MDGRKKSPPATAAGAPAPASASAAAPNGYFSSVFSASPAANAKDAKQPDLYAMLNKQNFKGQNGGAIADGKSNGSPTKGRTANKDGKQFYPTSHQSRLISALLCITVPGSSMVALHKNRAMNPRKITMRRIQMAPLLPEVIGGKVPSTTKCFSEDSRALLLCTRNKRSARSWLAVEFI
ncbi:hypothetical protein GUJ93_ZPchr0010g7743 [Zizania palustris]|uniref:Uncharacterized protein n=1 Tax=Zizania palustris TaxID=103762 RepID=A0A8J5WCN0_ZIZPA|nr:hypothetical protein GUJ93_ZPchr0010g7743 [Zizania palustris]